MQSRLFASPSPDMTFTADRVTQSGSELRHVFIRDIKDGEEHDITAQRGHIRIAEDGNAVEIELEDGMILTTSADHSPTVALFDHSTRYLSHAAQVVPFRQRGEDERELTSPELLMRLATDETTISRPHLLSELHFRLARCLTVPFIPLLATALAIARKRQRDVVGLPAAFIIMVGFDHLIQMAHSMAATGGASVLSIWLAAFVFMALCTVLLLYRSGAFFLLRALLENRLHGEQAPTGRV
jgi:lipopolysaccharide export system permease protein